MWALSATPPRACPAADDKKPDLLEVKALRDLPTIYTVIASFGVALILRSLVQLLWGSENEVFIEGVQKPLVLFDLITVSLLHLEAIAIIVVAAVALHIFLTRTRTGRSMLVYLAIVGVIVVLLVIGWIWMKFTEAVEDKLKTSPAPGKKPWIRHLGKLKRLHKETERINRRIEEESEKIDKEMWS